MYFCQKLTELVYAEGKLPIGYEFTLPTEAQWEYAACGGHMSEKYNKYSGGDIIDSVAWYADNAKKTTHPVGKKKANELGFYDMSGNVYEWCRDWFEEEYAKDAEFLHGNDNKQMDLRVAKGGGYTTKNPDNCRPSSRGIAPENGNHDVGFRIALAPIQ
jgi:formylglycine-generating enzyme required for sulfatase activity